MHTLLSLVVCKDSNQDVGNWMGDTSPMGIRRALGMTVNDVYRLSDVERNHEAYAKNYRVVRG